MSAPPVPPPPQTCPKCGQPDSKHRWLYPGSDQLRCPSPGYQGHISPAGILIIAVVVIIGLVIGVRLISNEQARNNPPVSCQLLGGQWSLWGGWHCGQTLQQEQAAAQAQQQQEQQAAAQAQASASASAAASASAVASQAAAAARLMPVEQAACATISGASWNNGASYSCTVTYTAAGYQPQRYTVAFSSTGKIIPADEYFSNAYACTDNMQDTTWHPDSMICSGPGV